MLKPITIWITFAVYMCFLAGVTIYVINSEKKDKSGGSLSKASVPWPVLVMTYVASLMSTWVFFAGPGAYYRGGLGYWLSEMSYIALFPIIAHFTMNKVWIVNQATGGEYSTPADFYYQRFKSPVLTVILGLIFLSASFPYISSVLVSIARAAEIATGGAINYQTTVIILGLTMTIFVAIGGVKSAAMADTVQGLLFIVLLWVIVGICLFVGFDGSLTTAISSLKSNTPAFFSYPGPESWVSYGSRFGYPFSCAIGWTIMLPHVFVRSGYFGDSLKAQRKLSYFGPALQGIVWTGTMLIGLIGLALVTDLSSGDAELIIPYMIDNFVNPFNGTLGVALMIGFFLGACAVGLSTANAFLSVSSSIIYSDLLKTVFKLDVSQKKEVSINRVIIVFIGLASTLLSLNPPELIFTLIMFAIAIVMPLFPILVFGIYWPRATKQAAIVSAIVGTIVVLMTYFVWDLGGVWYGAIGLVASTITMYLVSLFTKQDSQESKDFFELLEVGNNKFYNIVDNKELV